MQLDNDILKAVCVRFIVNPELGRKGVAETEEMCRKTIAKLTKKDFMMAFGRTFNLDLTDYDKDLSNSMASSTAYDKQTRIFDDMKEKHLEIYNSK